MEIRQLKYFVRIAEDQSYTSAAKKLYITQPTLSWTIKHLEKELGVKLFIPNGKKLALTIEGEELLHHANFLLGEHQKVLELFQNHKELLTGQIQLGVPGLIGTGSLMPIIMSFMEDYPRIKVKMHNSGSNTIQEMVESGMLELGIVSYVYPSSSLDAIDLPNFNFPIVLVVSNKHPLSTKPSVSFANLKNESFILLEDSFTITKLSLQACLRAGFTPNVVLKSSEWDIICEAVANSNNISILPYPFLAKSNRTDISIIPIDDPDSMIPIALITKKNCPKSLPLRKFIQFMYDNNLTSPRV